MKDLAPEITRIRLLVEGFYSGDMDEARVIRYLSGVADELGLKVYGHPTVHSPAGKGSGHNQGFDAFIPLIDSGISLYIWSQQRFFSALLYTCKSFDIDAACSFTQEFFGAPEITHSTFFNRQHAIQDHTDSPGSIATHCDRRSCERRRSKTC